MPWSSIWSSASSQDDEDKEKKKNTNHTRSKEEILDNLLFTKSSDTHEQSSAPSPSRKTTNWSSLLFSSPSQIFTSPENLLPTVLLTTSCIAFYTFYRTYLRRIPAAANISPGFFHKRSLLGRVTSVGDGDNFRVFHTPGGRLAGWGWLPWRRVPTERKELKDKTVGLQRFPTWGPR